MNGATTIQERLKDLRLNKGLKLEELAEQTGIQNRLLAVMKKMTIRKSIMATLSCWQIFMGCPSIISFAGQRTGQRSTHH